MGILANLASLNSIRNINFYKEILDIKFIPDIINCLKTMESAIPLYKQVVQGLAVLIHPLFGDIFTFPWKRNPSTTVNEFTECLTTF